MGWINKHTDPFYERERSKYQNPIPSREYIMAWLEERGKPAHLNQLIAGLGPFTDDEQEALRRRLKAMEHDGQLVRNRSDAYGLIDKMDLVRGIVVGYPEGYGYITPDEGGEDIFLPPRQMRRALHGDKVLVRVVGESKGRREGALVEVLERANTRVVGRYFLEGQVGYVTPDNKRLHQDIFIPPSDQNGAKPGQVVVAEITAQPTKRTPPVGRIFEILGEHLAPGMEADVVIRSYAIPHTWPQEVLQEVTYLLPKLTPADYAGRVDLRSLPLVTIDGIDAKDFDDAVYCKRTPRGGWMLLVAIADVSHYVRPGTQLDQEAAARGNSTYLPNCVVPMLPEILSNELCSLKPNVDRLCMVCEMHLSPKGKIIRHRFYNAVMCSQARLTYEEVQDILRKNVEYVEQYPLLVPHLTELYALYQCFFAERQERGALDFDTTETQIIFDKNRKVEKIVPLTRLDSHRLIEECMLAANVASAQFLEKSKLPTLYRIHPGPDIEKARRLKSYLWELGVDFYQGKKPKPKDYFRILQQTEERPDTHLIETMLLRSVGQAIYSPKNIGHFGLAHTAYTHFTSPIRRYPDLLVHRAIKHLIGISSEKAYPYDFKLLKRLGEHCSMTERRSDEASRDAIHRLKCEYMENKVGNEFTGTVSSVVGFGLFVELDDIYVDGLIHVSSLQNDYYHFDPLRHCLTGERTRTVFRIGDRVKVRVAKVLLDERKIDLDLLEATPIPHPAAFSQLPKKRKHT